MKAKLVILIITIQTSRYDYSFVISVEEKPDNLVVVCSKKNPPKPFIINGIFHAF
jgi:hypothetical protein